MDSTGSNRWSDRRQCTGHRPGINKPDPDQPDYYSSDSNLYSNTNNWYLCRSNLYGNSNCQPDTGCWSTSSNNMQRSSIYSHPGRRTSRYIIYMDSTGSNRWSDRRQCTGHRPGIDKPDTDQPDYYSSDSNLYSNTNNWYLCWSNLYGNSNCQPDTGCWSTSSNNMQRQQPLQSPRQAYL